MRHTAEDITQVFQSIETEIDLLYALGCHVVTEMELASLLSRVAELSCAVIKADTIAVPIIDHDAGEYRYQATYGQNAEAILNMQFPLSVGMCGWVLSNEQPLLFGEGNPMPLGKQTRWERGIESALLVPLISRGRIVGGLSAMGKNGGGSFTETDLKLLSIIASQVGIAIENAQMVQELRHLATYDQLTRLVNRLEFKNRINNLLKAKQATSQNDSLLCYMDLDRFKLVNDSCGHAAGDNLLQQISNLLLMHVGEEDTVARLGGDEFGLLLENCPFEKGIRIAEMIRRAVDDFHFIWAGKTFRVGISIGVVVLDKNHVDAEQAVIAADQACLTAKNEGRNRIKIFKRDDPAFSDQEKDAQWVSRIQDALEKDGFVLYFQPICKLQDNGNEKAFYEILLRMVDDDGSHVLPGGLIQTAERFGLMQAIDRWVITSYCNWLQQHRGHLDELQRCSINLSAQSIGDESFYHFLSKKILSSELPFDKFCFEITETAAITNATNALKFFNAMGAYGATFALDDFGTGMSSFNYLKSMPAEYVKIDGSFVYDIDVNPTNLGLVRAIIDIGHLMGKQLIAESVESDTVRKMLQGSGVDFVQGFGVAMPTLIDELYTAD
jgi:diguanylate cyclase (GGDEF)-like protein